ncbi:MocR-like pyridoxine biosynthesis transcription factor PdxR [Acidicapsa acidisoli]|uniref:MocR-like pyridoxine biosynthesis transcription factor PdxR n=1 Tax=Acidicapsa acidisoli TaxID=1615681 RepID=UPI0021E0C2EA|nr:PLP-dependent aminotransferase family protein [Acidicapsa acidisoli]
MDFVIPILRDSGPIFRQIYAALRDAVLAGKLPQGERLPSTRELAEHLHVSRTVVLLAYDQLLAEGYVSGRRGSGTFVAGDLNLTMMKEHTVSAQIRLSRYGRRAADASSHISFPQRRERPLRYDFAYGRSNIDLFPFEAWRRMLLRTARKAPVRELDYGAAAGSPELQEAIASHVKRSRGVVCDPSQVLIVNGSQQALDLIARVLVEPNDVIGLEEPGYQGTREVFRVAGARLHGIPVDHDGIVPEKITPGARMVLVTPSHQFPTGAVLSLSRRLALLDWAKRKRAVIVEDDYDGEFRYGGQALESLQGLDREGRVIYIGTFSRTVFPSLRIGYMIAPVTLVSAFTAAKWLCDRHTSMLEQQTLSEFIAGGMYERYLRRVRRSNTARRDALLESIDTVLGNDVEVTGQGAGAHVVLWPRADVNERIVIERAEGCGVGIYGLSGYYLGKRTRPGIILGYARLSESEIREGIRRLHAIFRPDGTMRRSRSSRKPITR